MPLALLNCVQLRKEAKQSYKYRKANILNRSYHIKLDSMIEKRIITREMLIFCLARYDEKIKTVAKQQKISAATYSKYGSDFYKRDYEEYTEKLSSLLDFIKPIRDTLMREYQMSLDEVKEAVKTAIGNPNMLTYKYVDIIRKIIISNDFQIEEKSLDYIIKNI